LAIYNLDQEAEDFHKQDWTSGRQSVSASEWRWLKYEGYAAFGNSRLRIDLQSENLVDPGTGSTFEVLEQRGLIECRYKKIHDPDLDETLFVKITPLGQKLVRQFNGIKPEKKLPVVSKLRV
jgi:hypothetical protein